MNTFRSTLIALISSFSLGLAVLAQPSDVDPAPAPPPAEEPAVAPDDGATNDNNQEEPPVPQEPAEVSDAGDFIPPQELDNPVPQEPEVKPASPERRTNSRVIRPSRSVGPTDAVEEGEKNLRLNFRGVPLDMVLNYLSEAAGFIINLETEVQGRVDVWSNQPLSRSEAIDILNSVLNKNGYAALRQGRTLTIVSRDEAKKRNIPVISGNDPSTIPDNDAIVTQIIPVRFISATQLVKDLQPLLPTSAELSANEGGNSLVLTDTQSNIKRMTEIVHALDQAIASVSKVQVFSLEFSDAKSVATTITSLFQTQETSRNNQGGPGRFFAQFQGGPGGANRSASASTGSANGRAPTPRVVAVADERSNSVIVSAPEEQMALIDEIIKGIDTNVDDITELRVFRLKHADPQETADLLTSLFEDPTTSRQSGNNRQNRQFRFGGNNAAAAASERTVKQTRVVAVPDLRTRSVVVSAARNLVDQIGLIVSQLDNDPARKQKVFVYSVENTDPQAVQEVIQSLFPEQNLNQSRNSRNTQLQNQNQLNNRQTQTRNQGRTTGNTLGTGLNGTRFGEGQ